MRCPTCYSSNPRRREELWWSNKPCDNKWHEHQSILIPATPSLADTGLAEYLVEHWPELARYASELGQGPADLAVEVLKNLRAELAECHAGLGRMRPVVEAACEVVQHPAKGPCGERHAARDRADILAAKPDGADQCSRVG